MKSMICVYLRFIISVRVINSNCS